VRKGTKLYSILRNKCPHCHNGRFFEGSFFRGIPKQHCKICGEKFSKEPGFYQGSYYVVYALGVMVFVAIWVLISLFLPNLSFNVTLIAILVGIIGSGPFTFPLSKIIWANFFFRYKGEPKNKIKNHETRTQ
jgi:uncharacterized protein (DUF983 family)